MPPYLITGQTGKMSPTSLRQICGNDAEYRRLLKLHPEVQAAYHGLWMRLRIYFNFRLRAGRTQGSRQRTAANVAAGRSAPTLKTSWHDLTRSRAIDVYVLDDKLRADVKAKNEMQYLRLAIEAELHGFRQIGWRRDPQGKWKKRHIKTRKGKMWDPYHIEFRGPHKNIRQAIAAEGVREK